MEIRSKEMNGLQESRLSIVYHWSPKKNRKSILQNGIKIRMSVYEYENSITGKVESWEPPYICTSLDPWTALCYCIPTFDDGKVPALDLYEVRLTDNDAIYLRNDMSRKIIEVRIKNSVSVDRIQYIATRDFD